MTSNSAASARLVRTCMKRSVLGALCVMFFVLSSSAVASAPDRGSFTVSGVQSFDCGSVVLLEPFTYTAHWAQFSDGRYFEHAFYDGVLQNPQTGQKWRDRNHETIRVSGDTITVDGVTFNLHPLGGGPVILLDVGHVVYSGTTGEFIRGSKKHPVRNLFEGSTAALCAAVT